MIPYISMKKSVLSIVTLVLSLNTIWGQQDAQYTQYMYNTLSVNPAYAGSRGVLSIAALHRSQWVGLDGAPRTQTLNISSPVSERLGLGLSIVNDEIGNGTNQDTYFDAAVSYTILVSDDAQLSFGFKAGGHFLNVDFNRLQNFQGQNNTALPPNIDKKFSPNFGAGMYYHKQNFYAGISAPNFLETEHFDRSGNGGSNSFLASERLNWYFISGYVHDLNADWKFKPAILFKTVRGAPLQVDLSANFLYKEKFSFGLAYRWSAAISALAGIQLTERLMVGLAYDREVTELGGSRFNDGSFEVFLRYEFKPVERTLDPRFF